MNSDIHHSVLEGKDENTRHKMRNRDDLMIEQINRCVKHLQKITTDHDQMKCQFCML